LDLTRHLCADPAIAMADSTSSPDHPMINPIWRPPCDRRRPDSHCGPASVVSLIRAALGLRKLVREPARPPCSFHP